MVLLNGLFNYYNNEVMLLPFTSFWCWISFENHFKLIKYCNYFRYNLKGYLKGPTMMFTPGKVYSN